MTTIKITLSNAMSTGMTTRAAIVITSAIAIADAVPIAILNTYFKKTFVLLYIFQLKIYKLNKVALCQFIFLRHLMVNDITMKL